SNTENGPAPAGRGGVEVARSCTTASFMRILRKIARDGSSSSRTDPGAIIRDRTRRALARRADLDLDLAGGRTARADDELHRNADQVGGGELAACALVGVIHQHIVSGRLMGRLELGADAVASLVARLHVDDDDIERRDGFGPDDAVLVMARLDDGGDQAGRPDAVGAHGNEMLLAVGA